MDAIVLRQDWLRAYDFTTDRGAAALNCQIASKCDPLFAAKNDPFDGAETGGAELHIAEQSRS
jgi:type IV secretion system protein VirB5